MVPPDSHRVSRAPRYSGRRWRRSGFGYGAVTLCGGPFQDLRLSLACSCRAPYNPTQASPPAWFGLLPVRSPLLGESLLFSLPGGTKMFQFPPFASRKKCAMTGLQPAGLSHSDAPGSKVTCTSPGIFAACRVLHRLREPRHPPCALLRFRSCSSYFQLSPAYGTPNGGLKPGLYFYGIRHGLASCGRSPGVLLTVLCHIMSKIAKSVENIGFEPMTPCLQGRCSSQLS